MSNLGAGLKTQDWGMFPLMFPTDSHVLTDPLRFELSAQV